MDSASTLIHLQPALPGAPDVVVYDIDDRWVTTDLLTGAWSPISSFGDPGVVHAWYHRPTGRAAWMRVDYYPLHSLVAPVVTGLAHVQVNPGPLPAGVRAALANRQPGLGPRLAPVRLELWTGPDEAFFLQDRIVRVVRAGLRGRPVRDPGLRLRHPFDPDGLNVTIAAGDVLRAIEAEHPPTDGELGGEGPGWGPE